MILDSNILIGYLNGDTDLVSLLQEWRKSGSVLFISSISAIEALSLSSLTTADIQTIEDFLSDFIVIPVDLQIARIAGALRRKYKLSVPDSAIVATASVHNLPLVTRDKKLQTTPVTIFGI